MKKSNKLLFLLSLLIIIIVSLKDQNLIKRKIYNFETKILNISLNEHNPYGLPISTIYYYLENIYNTKQDIHDIRTNISLEQLIYKIDSNQLIEARHATFHNIYDCDNIKYLSRNGNYEYIVKIEKDEKGDYNYLKIINDPINKGTFNFFNQEGNEWQRKFHHIDVVLWVVYGTGRDDYSTLDERLDFFFTKSSYCKAGEVEK